jgi:hypothetical protein
MAAGKGDLIGQPADTRNVVAGLLEQGSYKRGIELLM